MRNCLLRGWLILFSTFTLVGFASAQVPPNATHGISVKAGDSINISARAYTPRPKIFWRSLAKAVVPSLVLNRPTTRPKSALGEQRSSTVIFGAGVTVAPGAISLGNRHQAKPSIKLRLYDSDTRLLSTQTYKATKTSRRDWENLTINLKVEQDGFIDLLVDKGTGELVVNSIDYTAQDTSATGDRVNGRTDSSDQGLGQSSSSTDQPETDLYAPAPPPEETPPPPPQSPAPNPPPPGYPTGGGGGGGGGAEVVAEILHLMSHRDQN